MIKTGYIKALSRLELGAVECCNPSSDLMLDGLIRRFNVTTELAWKACREHLLELGCVEINGPKPVMREALSYCIIENELAWRNILEDRNSTSHVYNSDIAREISDRIISQYLPAFLALAKKFEDELSKFD